MGTNEGYRQGKLQPELVRGDKTSIMITVMTPAAARMPEWCDHALLTLSVAATIFSDVSLVPVFVLLGLCVSRVLWLLLARHVLSRTAAGILGLYAYALLSAAFFGGIASLETNGPIAWAGGEGRFFLYYWPMLAFLMFPRVDEGPDREGAWSGWLFALTVLGTAAAAVDVFGLHEIFRSHHAAGAVLSLLFILHYFRSGPGKRHHAVLALLCLVLLLGSNSRTALLATFLAIGGTQLVRLKWRQVAAFACVALLAIPLMQNLFPERYSRLIDAVSPQTFAAMGSNFIDAYRAEPPWETSSAWLVASIGRTEGNANLAIRGFLWGRALNEFAGSPIFGAGFGRFNDTGRRFLEIPAARIATEAQFSNPDIHTAHNTFLHLLAELGLVGAALLAVPAAAMLRRWRAVLRDPTAPAEARYWAEVGLICMLLLMLMGLTQHSLGAPIFGLTYGAVLGLAYTRAGPL